MFIFSLGMHDIFAWTAFLLCFVVFALVSRFLRALRKRHKAVWLTLGEPTAVYDLSPAIQWRVNRLLWKREYKQLGDPVLDRLAITVKVLTIAVVASMILAGFFWTGGE